jgi:ATPase subunit of ABC transporter with duplicated ATPase domains
MSQSGAIITFKDVNFEHNQTRPILRGANFVVRRGMKLTLMGQNGAGKSTLFSLITSKLSPDEGTINIEPRTTIAVSRQIIPREELKETVREFFVHCFKEKVYDIDPRIDKVLEVVNLTPSESQKESFKERVIGSFSGGQQARLLLASALIQEPDILLLDEPTNNLDVAGIEHLTEFLKEYKKTVLVISHDADFLNSFTQGVLYLNTQRLQVEQYHGNYHKVVAEITVQIEKEKRQNAQLEKQIRADKEKINYFSNKGGEMRMVAKRMRDDIEEAEENKVDVRKEDKTIRPFTIEPHQDIPLEVVKLTSVQVIRNHEAKEAECDVVLKRGYHLQIVGPNGIGKTTLLERLAGGTATGEHVTGGVKIGYYRQDFSNLNFDQSVFESLMSSMPEKLEEKMRSIAAGFLLYGDVMKVKVGSLSEGQKGLLAFAKLTMEGPGLLILDEPTNHINFRHIPVIARALHEYTGAMILVSHVNDFVEKIRIDEVLDLAKLKPVKKK